MMCRAGSTGGEPGASGIIQRCNGLTKPTRAGLASDRIDRDERKLLCYTELRPAGLAVVRRSETGRSGDLPCIEGRWYLPHRRHSGTDRSPSVQLWSNYSQVISLRLTIDPEYCQSCPDPQEFCLHSL